MQSVGVSMLQRSVPEKMSGTFFGYFNMLTTGITMGGYVLGIVGGSTYTVSAVYLYGGGCSFAVLMVWFWFYRRWKKGS